MSTECSLLIKHLDMAKRCLDWIEEYSDCDGDDFSNTRPDRLSATLIKVGMAPAVP